MDTTSKPSVLPLNREIETKDSSGEKNNDLSQVLQDKIKSAVEEYFDDYLDEIVGEQKEMSRKLGKLDDAFSEEVENVRKIFQGLGEEFDKFKTNIREFIENKIPSDIEMVRSIQEDHIKKINEFEQKLSELKSGESEEKNESIDELREELIIGIRMIGKRVTKAVKEMENRFKEFTDQVQDFSHQQKKVSNQIENEFGNIKESILVNYEKGYDIIPKNSVERLLQLFKKQSTNMNKIIEVQQEKITDFEQLLKGYDEESSKLMERLNNKAKRNLYISIAGMTILFILLILFKFAF